MLIASLLTSCNMTSKQSSPSPQNKQGTPRAQSVREHPRNLASQKQVDVRTHLEKLAEKVPGVKKANVVITGNTAIVGIDVDGDLDRSRVGTIKYSVAEALRKDPYGKNAIVTADVDISKRLAEIGNDIRRGHPISGFASELADIVGRIMPQVPSDTKAKR
ncbi:YhcN/YlaJ family sporulation lipoprotein [Paenibacillus sediminis]